VAAALVPTNRATGHEKVVFVGHSQGNAQAFVGLSRNPQVAEKIELFVALAPAFYIGRLGYWLAPSSTSAKGMRVSTSHLLSAGIGRLRPWCPCRRASTTSSLANAPSFP
jgi:pimeloyl-ACP methyl ester carboxylesterase